MSRFLAVARVALVGALVPALAGCGHGSSSVTVPPGPTAPPSTSGHCRDLPLIGPDGGMVLGTDWTGEQHAYGAPVVVYACATTAGGGRVRLVARGTGVAVRPAGARIDPSGNGVVPFRVTVEAGAVGGLRVQQDGGGVEGDAPGPDVVAEADGWHFASAG